MDQPRTLTPKQQPLPSLRTFYIRETAALGSLASRRWKHLAHGSQPAASECRPYVKKTRQGVRKKSNKNKIFSFLVLASRGRCTLLLGNDCVLLSERWRGKQPPSSEPLRETAGADHRGAWLTATTARVADSLCQGQREVL